MQENDPLLSAHYHSHKDIQQSLFWQGSTSEIGLKRQIKGFKDGNITADILGKTLVCSFTGGGLV